MHFQDTQPIPLITQLNAFARQTGIAAVSHIEDFLIYSYESEGQLNFNNLPLYRQSYYELMVDVTPGCALSVDGYTVPVHANRITLIRPFRLQKIAPYDTGADTRPVGFGILFQPSLLTGTSLAYAPALHQSTVPSISLPDAGTGYLQDIASKMLYEYRNYNPGISDRVIRNYLEILLLKLLPKQQLQSQQPSGAAATLFNAFREKVAECLLDFQTVKEYADSLFVTPKHLSEMVKKMSGKSALTFINEARIDYVRFLLQHTGKPIAQIAFELRFENPDYFSAFFKKHTGMSPSGFRLLQR